MSSSMRDTIMKGKNRIWWLFTATVLDRALTSPNFHLESNPLVEWMGWQTWLVVTAVVIGIAVSLWFDCQLWESGTARASVTIVSVMTFYAVLLNLIVIF